ncbi:hypothetical protein [Streptomyces avermitilis]|uniref:hypothetical protein n=1 Tax=Streptomyces avermitilis TaxID=33903 RepID=UPI003724B309
MDGIKARRDIDAAFALWRRRSADTWRLDLSILTDAGITIQRSPSAAQRPGVAAATLAAERAVPRPSAPADEGEIAIRIAVERGIALPSPTPASPQPTPSAPPRSVGRAAPAPRDEDSASFLQRLLRRGKR